MLILKYLMEQYNIALYSTKNSTTHAILDYSFEDKFDIMSHLKIVFDYVEETDVVRDLKNNLIDGEVPTEDHIITKGILFKNKVDY